MTVAKIFFIFLFLFVVLLWLSFPTAGCHEKHFVLISRPSFLAQPAFVFFFYHTDPPQPPTPFKNFGTCGTAETPKRSKQGYKYRPGKSYKHTH